MARVVQAVKLTNERKTMVLDYSVLTFWGGLVEEWKLIWVTRLHCWCGGFFGAMSKTSDTHCAVR